MTTTYVAFAAGETLLVEIETTPGAGTYSAPATINLQRSIDFSATIDKTPIPRVDTPSAPGFTDGVATAFDWKVSGQGTLNTGDDLTWANWLISGARKNIRVSNANATGMVLVGPALLATFNMSGDGIGKKVQGTISLEGAGLPTLTAHA